MKLKLSVITIGLLYVILATSSKLIEHKVVENANTQSNAAAEILGSNPNQSQNEEGLRNQQDKSTNTQNLSSQYIGVSWDRNNKKWRVQLMHKGKKYFACLFDNEKHAAMKVNLLCDKLGKKRKNSMIDIEFDKIQKQFKTLTSKYNGVSWHKDRKKWRAQLIHDKTQHYGGLFHKEEDAAMKVNLLCDKYELKRKNTMIDMELFEDQKVRNSTSQYIGVSWDENNKKWRARLFYNGKKYSGGVFDNEKDAAMTINLLCDKFGIQRKNLMIDIDFDAILQKTKSKMYGSKAENIVNEKEVKVEEENILYGLKDQCENNFMKQTCQSQKRKRKENLILLLKKRW